MADDKTTARRASPHYTVRRDHQGYAAAIERDGYTVLILAAGAERNEQEVDALLAALTQSAQNGDASGEGNPSTA